MDDQSLIRRLEERAFNAWPARQTVLCGGWLFRFSDGLSKRANSANPLAPAEPFATVREQAERLYARHGLPAIFRLSPLAPSEADAALDAAGYAHFDPSRVMLRPLTDPAPEPDGGVIVSSTPSADWLAGFAAANAIRPAHRATHDAMITAIALPAGFATLTEQGEPIGFGLAILEASMVGLFDIVVAPLHRGRGYGRRLTKALLAWGRGAGAATAYLQVRDQNAVGLGLYESLGFREVYRYHYRVPASF